MSAEQLFNIVNTIALIGWVILIALPFWKQSDKYIMGIIVTLLAIVYAYLIFIHFKPGDTQKFSTLDGVSTLFENPWMVVAGWVHYLAFDLVVGLFIKNNGNKFGIKHWWLAPCMFFTFMLGPIGLLLYLLVRWAHTRSYFTSNH